MAAEQESVFPALFVTLIVLCLTVAAWYYWRRATESSTTRTTSPTANRTAMIMVKAGASVGGLCLKIAWRIAEAA
eukprot:6286645-Pyramimonas_sp.AAC.1